MADFDIDFSMFSASVFFKRAFYCRAPPLRTNMLCAYLSGLAGAAEDAREAVSRSQPVLRRLLAPRRAMALGPARALGD